MKPTRWILFIAILVLLTGCTKELVEKDIVDTTNTQTTGDLYTTEKECIEQTGCQECIIGMCDVEPCPKGPNEGYMCID